MPTAPTGVTVTRTGANTALVTWNAVANVDGYTVYSISTGDVYAPQAVPGGGSLVTATSYVLTILSGRMYGVKVTATAASVESSRSSPVWLDNTGLTIIPGASYVYAGAGAFGVGGTSTGTLTLPAPSSVLSTAPAYGVGGNGSQGTASPTRRVSIVNRIIRILHK
jgi:hypothetical protein